MCMGGACKKCGTACKAPEPKVGVDRGGPMKGDRVAGGPTHAGTASTSPRRPRRRRRAARGTKVLGAAGERLKLAKTKRAVLAARHAAKGR